MTRHEKFKKSFRARFMITNEKCIWLFEPMKEKLERLPPEKAVNEFYQEERKRKELANGKA